MPMLERLELVERLRDSIAINHSDPSLSAQDKDLIGDTEVVLKERERFL